MHKPSTLYAIIIVLIGLVIFTGWTEKRQLNAPLGITWSRTNLDWSNFTLVDSLENDFVATIDSEIYAPEVIPDSDFEIYAYMDPTNSFKLADSILNEYTLKHEQYHFNITEYHARLLRRDLIHMGRDNLTETIYDSLFQKYSDEKNVMQVHYDSITNHSVNSQEQRYWELYLDDLFRQTAYFEHDNLDDYYAFNHQATNYYRHIYATFGEDILTSYPVTEAEAQMGFVYKVEDDGHEIRIEYLKHGKPYDEGYFDTALTTITKSDSVTITKFYNKDHDLNTKLDYCIRKRYLKPDGKLVDHFFNSDEARVSYKTIYEQVSETFPNDSIITQFYNKVFKNTTNKDGIYKKARLLDTLGRSVGMYFLNMKDEPMNDIDYVAKIKKTYDANHKTTHYQEFDESGDFAIHLNSYNSQYTYDDRGNTSGVTNLNEVFEPAPDKQGVAIYHYTYDLNDNITSSKRFNKNLEPVRGLDLYHMEVSDYDDQDNMLYYGKFCHGYVLAFDEDKWGAVRYEYLDDNIELAKNVDVYDSNFNADTGVAQIKRFHDEQGRVIKKVYLNADGNFAQTIDSIVDIRNKYDQAGNTVEEAYFDSLGNRRSFEQDVAVVKWDYDAHKNKIKTTYYNRDLELANANQDVTYNIYEYNTKNELVSRSNYNKNMKPQLFDGYFRTDIIPDSKGNDSIWFQYDIDNKPLQSIYKTVYIHNKYDKQTEESYFNEQHEPTVNGNGVHKIVYLYNQKQQAVGYVNYDVNGNKVNGINGIAYNIQKLNEFGFIDSDSYYDKDDLPVHGPEGYHRKKYQWDSRGEIIELTYFDKYNNLLPDGNGVARYVYTNNEAGMTHSVKRFDSNNQPTNDVYGVSETYYMSYLNGLYYLDYELDYLGNRISDEGGIDSENVEE